MNTFQRLSVNVSPGRLLQPAFLGFLARKRYALLLASVLWLVAACSRSEPQPLQFNPAPWQDGEVSIYQAADLNQQYAGTARIEIARGQGDSWSITRQVLAQGLEEVTIIEVQGRGYRPNTSHLTRTDNSGREQVTATYSNGQVDIELTSKQDITTYERMNVPSDARDQRTLVVLLRSLPLAEGYATRMNSFFPIAGLLDRVTISVADREQVETPAGTFDTWHVEMDTGDSRSEAWIGVEAPHPLVKFTDGRTQGTFVLTEFESGE